MTGWVGTVHYEKRGRGPRIATRQLRFADPQLGPCLERLEIAMVWLWWLGHRILASAFGRGMIWSGEIHWEGEPV